MSQQRAYEPDGQVGRKGLDDREVLADGGAVGLQRPYQASLGARLHSDDDAQPGIVIPVTEKLRDDRVHTALALASSLRRTGAFRSSLARDGRPGLPDFAVRPRTSVASRKKQRNREQQRARRPIGGSRSSRRSHALGLSNLGTRGRGLLSH